jgi:hypothetical protein
MTTTDKATRRDFLARLKQLPENRIVEEVERLGLGAQTSKWDDDQLRQVVEAIEGPATGDGETADASEETSTDMARYTVLFNEKDKSVAVRAAGRKVPEGAYLVATLDDVKGLDRGIQQALFNAGKQTPATRFANADALAQGAFANLAQAATVTPQAKGAQAAEAEAPAAAATKGGARKATTKGGARKTSTPRAAQPVDLAPKAKDKIRAVRRGSKVSILIDLLARKTGATLDEVAAALSKTGSTVTPAYARAWIGYSLNSIVGYGAKQEGNRIRLVLPKGLTAPLPHKVAEEKPVKVPAKTSAKTAAKTGRAATKVGARKAASA